MRPRTARHTINHRPKRQPHISLTIEHLLRLPCALTVISPSVNENGQAMFRLILILLLLAFPSAGQSSPDCSQWLIGEFWQKAKAEDVKRCLAAGADANARDDLGRKPLHRAAARGTAETINALVAAGADIDARGGKYGRTPLHWAAMFGKLETINALLQAGADINTRDNNIGGTPLHSAAALGTAETINALLKGGANIEARGKLGATPLHTAAANGTAETINALLAAGANIRAKAEGGFLPADLAEKNEAVRNDPVFWKLNEGRYP